MTSVSLTKGSIVFTFVNGEVNNVRSETMAQPDVIPMPGSPPMSAIIIDLGGVTKNITITGQLFETDSSVTTGTSATTITSVLDQKEWLESVLDGSQSSMFFTSNFESASVSGLNGATAQTKVVATRLSFDENTGDPNILPFSMAFKVGT